MNSTVLLGIVVVCLLIIYSRPHWYLRAKSYISKPRFYDMSDFPELRVFEDNFAEIRKECLNVTQKINYDIPRPQEVWSGKHKKKTNNYLAKNKDMEGWSPAWAPGSSEGNARWLNFPLIGLGTRFENNLKQCPKLAKLLEENKSFIRIAGFSKLLPAASIYPHVDAMGMPWSTLPYHLGLVVPKDGKCTLTVDGETVYQKEGQSIIFEPTYTHAADNISKEDRIILFLEINV